MRLLGIILVVAGTLALIYGGFSFITQEKIVDVGPVEVRADRERTVWVPPLLGALSIGAGLLLVLSGRREVTVVNQ